MRFDSARGQAMAARSASRRRKLTLEDAEQEIPPLDSEQNIRLAAEKIQRWGVAGLLPGVVIHSCIRACEVALRALAQELDVQRVPALEARVRELEADLAEARRAG